jgi:heme/copper-type cytochrome/quinol oxidase subunit 1
MVFTLAGLWVSYQFNLASGATIIMVAGFAFFLSLAVDAVAGKRRQTADRRRPEDDHRRPKKQNKEIPTTDN